MIGLNTFRTKLLSDLQQKSAWRHTHNSAYSNKSSARYNEKVFIYCEFLHDTIKDAAHCISCNPNKPNNIINVKCALVFCDECPK